MRTEDTSSSLPGNNGKATTFGASNGTNLAVAETIGIEAAQPINALSSNIAVPTNNSAEVDPLMHNTFVAGRPDKLSKDNHFRGITEFGGALYFTNGSGSNGIDTVYTVNSLPTLQEAAEARINVVPGFRTESAKEAGGDFTPLVIFFC
jgi:hypothetical protein